MVVSAQTTGLPQKGLKCVDNGSSVVSKRTNGKNRLSPVEKAKSDCPRDVKLKGYQACVDDHS